jgi:hypothetical protein
MWSDLCLFSFFCTVSIKVQYECWSRSRNKQSTYRQEVDSRFRVTVWHDISSKIAPNMLPKKGYGTHIPTIYCRVNQTLTTEWIILVSAGFRPKSRKDPTATTYPKDATKVCLQHSIWFFYAGLLHSLLQTVGRSGTDLVCCSIVRQDLP